VILQVRQAPPDLEEATVYDPEPVLRRSVFRFNLAILVLIGSIAVLSPIGALVAVIVAGKPLSYVAELVGGWQLTEPSNLIMLLLWGVAAASSIQAIRYRDIKGTRLRLSLLSIASLVAGVGVAVLGEITANS